MKTTSENIIYIDSNGNILDNDYNYIDIDNLSNIKNLSIVIDDSYFIYEVVKPKFPKTSKIKLLAKNYLKSIYPEELIENLYILNLPDKSIIVIPLQKFITLQQNFQKLFDKAKKISTPALECLNQGEKAEIETDKYIIKIDDSIEYKQKNNNIPKDEEIKIESVTLNIFKENSYLKNFKDLLLPIVTTIICFILLNIGYYFDLKIYKEKYHYINNKLIGLYKQAGVYGDYDPYGKLLYKAQKNSKLNNQKILPVLYKITKSFGKIGTIESLSYKENSFFIDGTTLDFKALDNIKNNLNKSFNKDINIINTKLEDNRVIFTLKVNL